MSLLNLDEDMKLVGIITNRDIRFEKDKDKIITEEGASAVIIKELWKKLRKTHALRIVR